MKLKISVLIITKDRSRILENCLHSIMNQEVLPYEVVIVDNASSDNTRQTVKKWQKKLPIKYFYEDRVGIPYARNIAIKNAGGDVLLFTDDDCIYDPSYIGRVIDFFNKHKKADAVIGYSLPVNYFPTSAVEQYYYERWLKNFIPNIPGVHKIKDGKLFDFKNAVIKRRFFKQLKKGFSEDLVMGDKEDTEMGIRIVKQGASVYYSSDLIVRHQNSHTVKKLLMRNYRHGLSTYDLLKRYHVVLYNNTSITTNVGIYLSILKKVPHIINKIVFSGLLFIYPFASKTGKLLARFYI